MALRLSSFANGVSKLNAEVAGQMWSPLFPKATKDRPAIAPITNGVHPTTWVGEDMMRVLTRALGASWSEPPLDPEVERIYERVRRVELLERAETEPPMPGRPGAPTLRLRQRRASDDWFTLAPVRVDDIPTLISKPITLAPPSPSEDATVILLDSRRRKRR